MRIHFIDNIRILAILMLFPYHTCMIYNGYESFYIHGPVVSGCDLFIFLTSIWFMPLLFFISGSGSFFAMKKRSVRQYSRERVARLLIPLISGIVLLVPFQSFFANKFHNQYSGDYFSYLKVFFTTLTDMTGYDGAFTTGQLWFILYLFLISLLAIPLMLYIRKREEGSFSAFFHPVKILLFCLIPFLLTPVLEIGGKSLGAFFGFFILGFLFSKRREFYKVINKWRLFYLVLTLSGTGLYYVLYRRFGWPSGYSPQSIAFGLLRIFLTWSSILTIIGYGCKLNRSTRLTAYFNRGIFPIYIFHQTWLVIAAYYLFKITDNFAVQFVFTIIISFILSLLSYEVVKRFKVTRILFGIK